MTRRIDAPTARRLKPWLLGLAVVACAAGAFALRHTGQVPYGSDNDEYLLVAHTLLHRGEPTVAGIEGTKYPLGLPCVLAGLEAVGLPPGRTWLWVEAALVLGIALLASALAATAAKTSLANPTPWIAGLFCATSYALWQRAGAVMTDVAFTAVVLGALAVEARMRRETRGRLGGAVALTALAAVAVSLRSVGVVLAIAASVRLVFSAPRARRWAVAPVMVAGGLLLATHLWVAGYPAHTTGYSRVFWLRNPFDEALGRVGLAGVLARIPRGIADVVGNAGTAILGYRVPVLGLVTVALPVVGLIGLRSLLGGLFFLGYLGALAVWPFHSPRFALPLVPVAGIGLALALGALGRALKPRALVLPVVAVCILSISVPQVIRLHRLGRWQGHHLQVLDQAAREVAARLDRLQVAAASYDYRALTRRAGRIVRPLRYTHDVAGMLEALRHQGVAALVLTPHRHDIRGHYSRLIQAHLGPGAVKIYDDGIFEILRLPGTTSPARAPRGSR